MRVKTVTRWNIFGLAVVLVSATVAKAQQQSQSQNDSQYPRVVYLGSTLTVNEVIKLSRAGISDDAIIQQLAKSGGPSHLSSSDLVRLKNAGVSDRVIASMLNTGAAQKGQGPVQPAQSQSPTGSAPTQSAIRSTPPSQQANAGGDTSGQPAPSGTPTISAASESIRNVGPLDLPSEPGLYFLAGHEHTKILGQPVTFERTGSRLVSGVTLHVKAAHDNIQLPGSHAQTTTGTKPTFAFIPSRNESDNGVTAGDLLLIRFEVHGDRRQIEIAAGGSWRTSKGVSITHQLEALRSEPAPGVYEITPANPLKVGEYAVYLQRGEGLPALLYDFSVQNVR